MLRLKDLFKIDLSSKGGGKLADKIFNKYNITKEERKEIKNEIASGGGGGDSEEPKLKYIYIKIRFSDENINDYISIFTHIVPAMIRTNYQFTYGHFTQEIPFNDSGIGFLEQDYFNCKILDTIYKIYNQDGSIAFEGNFIELCTTLGDYIPNIITEEEYLNNI